MLGRLRSHRLSHRLWTAAATTPSGSAVRSRSRPVLSLSPLAGLAAAGAGAGYSAHGHAGVFEHRRGAVRWMSTTFAGSTNDLYRELGCPPDVTAAELKQAYHKLAREYHPDLTNNKSDAAQDAAHDRFVKITAAFDVLGDTTKRREYDRTLVVAAAYGTPAGRTVNGYTYRTTGRGEYSDDQGYGFHKGDFDGHKSPYKIFSNTGIVFLALTWMIGGIVVHIWRFTEAQEEVTAMVEQRSRNAAASLNQAQSRARENGHMLQLEMLRDRANANKVVVTPAPPAGSVVS